MERARRAAPRTALAALLLLLCTTDPGSVAADSLLEGGRGHVSGNPKSILLSMKISGAKKRNRRVSFFKSVARQAKNRPTVCRFPPSGR